MPKTDADPSPAAQDDSALEIGRRISGCAIQGDEKAKEVRVLWVLLGFCLLVSEMTPRKLLIVSILQVLWANKKGTDLRGGRWIPFFGGFW